MKRQLILALVLFFGLATMAAPLKNIPIRLTQPNGQIINCYASGDEFYNYLHDANGFTIVKGDNGYYVYAIHDAKGEVVPSAYLVNSVDPASVGLKPYVKISEAEYYARRQAWESKISRLSVKNTKFPNGRELNHGTYNNLVVFIRFAGDTYHNTPFSTVQAMFNADEEDANSLYNFYHHTSYNQLELWSYFFPEPDGETVLSYEDIHPKEYYQPYDAATNPIGYHDEERVDREFSLLERAINYIEDMVPESIDLDYNGDEMVDNVVFVCKGETGAWNSLLWPHRWTIFDRDVRLHGLRVWDFNLQLEQGGYFNVSTLCHEMFHSLGAPDLYHYSGGNYSPVGSWDLMCSNTEPPQQPSVYMKYKYGNWIDEIPIIDPNDPNAFGTYELESNAWEGGRRNGFMIPTTNPYQYFFIEYRNKQNYFDSQIPGRGLLIYRIDTRFDGNASYNGTDYFDEVYLFRPGGTPSDPEGYLNMAHFCKDGERTSFGNDTDPRPFLSNGQLLDWAYRITNISNTGDKMSFDFRHNEGDSEPGPENFYAHVNTAAHQVELTWDASLDADHYMVYRDGEEISGTVSGTTFTHPYTEADNGYHLYSVMSVRGITPTLHSAPSDAWVILGNYETILITLSCDADNGTQGGELEVTFSNPLIKPLHLSIYQGKEAQANLNLPSDTEIAFRWIPGFDSESNGIGVNAKFANSQDQGLIFNTENPEGGILATYTAREGVMGFALPQRLSAIAEGTDVRLHWTMPTENNLFAIYRDDVIQSAEVSGFEYLDNTIMRSGSQRYQVETSDGTHTSWSPENTVYATVMNYYCEPPRNLQGAHHSTYNELHWSQPQFVGKGMLAYDNDKFETSIGSSSQRWGIKILPEQLAFFEGQCLTHLEMFDCTAANYTFKIYNGEEHNNSTLMLTQEQAMTGSGDWVRFALAEDLWYDASLPIWISVQSTGSNHPIPCCAYGNDSNGSLFVSNSNWTPAIEYDVYYTWMLRAYTSGNSSGNDFTYNLYVGSEEAEDHEMVRVYNGLAANEVTHDMIGNAKYCVTATWDGRETGFSDPVYLGPSMDVEETTVSSDDHFAIISNGNIIVNGEGTLQVIDMLGRQLSTYKVHSGFRLPTYDFSPSVYLLRLIDGDNVRTQRILVR